MPVTRNLTPAPIANADHVIAQTPALGGEYEAFLTSKQSRLLVSFFCTADDSSGETTFFQLPSTTPGPILAVVRNEIRGATAAVGVTYCGITATFTPPLYARNQGFDFPACKAIELLGTLTTPDITSVPVVTNAKRGTKIDIIEMPALADFIKVGATNSEKIKMPMSTSKNIANRMDSSYWTTQGKTEIGTLEIEGLDFGVDDGLARFGGVKCQVMLRLNREDLINTRHEFYLDWTPSIDRNNPEQDGEAKVTASGMFSRAALLSADGTP
jgi:hypothetical protein